MQVSINGIPLVVKLADDDFSRTQGLQGVPHLESDVGMLFRWPSAHLRSFWMKDTSLPLDIAYIADDGRIINIEEMEPFSLRSITSAEPAVCALEVNSGWFDKNNIRPGDVVDGVFNDMPKLVGSLVIEGSSFELASSDFYYQEAVEPIVEDIMALLPDVMPSEEVEYLNEYPWNYPINVDAWLENWGDNIPFFDVALAIIPEDYEADHPGWNIEGFAGEGGDTPGVLEVKLQVRPGTRFSSELIVAFEAELSNVIAHELHHLTQDGAPFERPSCPATPRREGDSYYEYFTSACEVPAFLIGFRAESAKTGLAVKDLISRYLDNQVAAGLLSTKEAEDISARWTGHSLWSRE